MKTKALSLILALFMVVGIVPTSIIPTLVVETEAASSTSAESILNSAALEPDHFLAVGSNDYWVEGSSSDIDQCLTDVLDEVTNDSMTTYEKVKAIYDYIIENTEYAYGGYGNSSSVECVLIDHIGTCADYNYVMMAFLRYIGIDAALVSGKVYSSSSDSYSGHQWCEAYINGVTYIFDPQVEDRIAERNGGTIIYNRFCKTYDELPNQYILTDKTYRIYFAAADSNVDNIPRSDGTNINSTTYTGYDGTLRDVLLTDTDKLYDSDIYAEGISSFSFVGWYYDEACTQPVDLDATIRRRMIIWAKFSVDPFTDVSVTQYYANAVDWAVSEGITKGTTDTTFSPLDDCLRCEVVTFLWRAAGSPSVSGVTNPFTDVKKSDYFYEAVLWAVSEGITSGTSATKFSPYETCERCQVVTFLWRLAGEPSVSGVTNPFKDVKTSEYYYSAVLWAVNNGITTGTSSTKFSPTDDCLRCQIVTFLYRYFVDSYIVSFDVNGGDTTVSSQRVSTGLTADEPSAPKRTGYTFLGWYTADGEEYDFSTPVTENVELHAEWALKKMSISFVFDGMTWRDAEAVEVSYGSTIPTEYQGETWYVAENISGIGNCFVKWDNSAPVTETMFLYTRSAAEADGTYDFYE